MSVVVEVKCLRHIYPDSTTVDLCGLDMVVRAGERAAVLGPNGSGKSTLLAHITGLLKPVEGAVKVLGADPVREFLWLRRQVGVVLQNVDEQIIGPTVWDDVAFAPKNYGIAAAEVRRLVEDTLELLGISFLAKKIPHYLSGGEKKKVAMAGALVLKPRLLVLDEPLAGLDTRSRQEMVDILNRVNRELGTTIIMTTHDVQVLPSVADIVYLLCKGHVCLHGSPAEILSCPERLREANLDPPVLVELFHRLAEQGLPVSLPLSVSAAADQIMGLVQGTGLVQPAATRLKLPGPADDFPDLGVKEVVGMGG